MVYDTDNLRDAVEYAAHRLAHGASAEVVVQELNAQWYYCPFNRRIGNKVYNVGLGGYVTVLGPDLVNRRLDLAE